MHKEVQIFPEKQLHTVDRLWYILIPAEMDDAGKRYSIHLFTLWKEWI